MRVALVGVLAWVLLVAAFGVSIDRSIRDQYPTPIWVLAEGAVATGILWLVILIQALVAGSTSRERLAPTLGVVGVVVALVVMRVGS
jgi:hypothetical protein